MRKIICSVGVLLAVNFLGYPVITTSQLIPPANIRQEDSVFIYISYCGSRFIKEQQKTIRVIEYYRLPLDILNPVRKMVEKIAKSYHPWNQRLNQYLIPFYDSIKVCQIVNEDEYKDLFPSGLKSDMIISVNDFRQWDFLEEIKEAPPEIPESIRKIDSILNSFDPSPRQASEPMYHLTDTVIYPAPRFAYQKTRSNGPLIYPFDKPLPVPIDTIFNRSLSASPLLGVQRIYMELFDMPDSACFFSCLYEHYVDSIAMVIREMFPAPADSPYVSLRHICHVLPKRFPFRLSASLYRGVRDNLLDCDNYSYMAYDIGQMLGIDVSIVIAFRHVFLLSGEYAFDPVFDTSWVLSESPDGFRDILYITNDPKKIHALLTTLEIGHVNLYNDNLKESYLWVQQGLKVNPKDPHFLHILGLLYNAYRDYENAFRCFYLASQQLPWKSDLQNHFIREKYNLLSLKKEDVLLNLLLEINQASKQSNPQR